MSLVGHWEMVFEFQEKIREVMEGSGPTTEGPACPSLAGARSGAAAEKRLDNLIGRNREWRRRWKGRHE